MIYKLYCFCWELSHSFSFLKVICIYFFYLFLRYPLWFASIVCCVCMHMHACGYVLPSCHRVLQHFLNLCISLNHMLSVLYILTHYLTLHIRSSPWSVLINIEILSNLEWLNATILFHNFLLLVIFFWQFF